MQLENFMGIPQTDRILKTVSVILSNRSDVRPFGMFRDHLILRQPLFYYRDDGNLYGTAAIPFLAYDLPGSKQHFQAFLSFDCVFA